jgi:hypothetical protein
MNFVSFRATKEKPDLTAFRAYIDANGGAEKWPRLSAYIEDRNNNTPKIG